jgi:hypothetical protein
MNAGIASGKEQYVGGIIGSVLSPFTDIESCVNAGFINGANSVGGIVGSDEHSMIANSINIGVVTLPICRFHSHIGGIVGEVKGSINRYSNCYYDRQLCAYGGIGNNGRGQDSLRHAEGRLTQDMISAGLRDRLGTAN